MGPRVMRRLPKFVHGFIDRHGKPRFYFRRAGHKKLPLPGLPWSPEFMAAYQEAIEGAPRIQIGANRSKTGTVAAAVADYFGSASFVMCLADSTRRTRRRILERFREQHGDKGIATLGKIHVERMVNAKAGTPGEALNFLVAIRALMRHAITAGLRADDPNYWCTGPKVPLRGVLHLDRGGHCGLRGEASQGHPSSACVCAAAVHGSAPSRCRADGPSARPRGPAKRHPSQDSDNASDPAARRAAGGIRGYPRGEHEFPGHPRREAVPPGCVLALVQAQVHGGGAARPGGRPRP
jgi:hypothetical protein